MRNKVSDLQSKLSHAAKQSLDRRFGALYDKIYREDVIWEAWKRVKANKGGPGVDEQDFKYIEESIGVEQFLREIRDELKSESYRPLPVLRCYIDKPGKPEKRPLGIPIIKDRVCQMACKLVIEPIFETNFLECSHGFRPGRSAHDAIRVIDRHITFREQSIVIDADIAGFFDNIRQDILMELVERRISDPRVLRLIRMWLEAGVMEEGKYIEGNGMGTPQGGVVSPLLSNIYLHSFDKMFKMSGIPGTLVRYADDFVILLWRNGKKVLRQVERMLGRLGLKLHPEKTRVVRAEDGFDFLGIHFRLCPVRMKNAKVKNYCALWPSDRSMKRIKERIKEVIGRRYSLSLEELIEELNPVIRGWDNYQRKAMSARKRVRKLNGFVRDRLRIFLKRKYSDQSRGTRRVHNGLAVRLGLYQFG
ncbi:MAG: group II intron reverse transcriptase/maturase [Thermodesulfobacteriota bacterium]|nr:group II intron reverse transcriptase/maturase [Thermodesulfobacteriota bacterium]